MSTSAATFNSPSTEWTDVSNTVRQASTGDIVNVPAGGSTWTNSLRITNGIWLIGAGANATFITNTVMNGVSPWALIHVDITNDAPIRISGFYFFLTTNVVKSAPGKTAVGAGAAVFCDPLKYSFNPFIHTFRFDHNNCVRAPDRALELEGSVYGVIDHCYFEDCSLTIEPVSGHIKEWNRFTPPLWGMGTTNTIVVESCTLSWTDWATNSGGLGQAPAAAGQGGHYVWRYNLLTNVPHNSHMDGWDLHGNNFYFGNEPGFTNTPQPGWKGSIWLEYYGNTNYMPDNAIRLGYWRGGTIMCFSNQIFYTGTPVIKPLLQEEEAWDSTDFSPLRTLFPAQDQITNSFFWNNSTNGVVTSGFVNIATQTNTISTVFITLGRDYWTSSPYATPYTNGDGAINAMVNYVPLIYPHPLVTAQDATTVFSGATLSGFRK